MDEADDLAWKSAIEKVLEEFPYYGFRRMAKELRRRMYFVNRKKVQRLMKKYGLSQKKRKWKPYTTDSRHRLPTYPNLIKNMEIVRPDQIWVADITYIRLPRGFCYLAVIMDVFTRKPRGWCLMTTMETILVMTALETALRRGTPEYHHSDRGRQYCSFDYTGRLREKNVEISMSEVGMSVDNAYAESFFRTLKVEEVYLHQYETVEEARASIHEFIDIVYTAKRIHSSLGYQTPEEYEKLYFKGRTPLTANTP